MLCVVFQRILHSKVATLLLLCRIKSRDALIVTSLHRMELHMFMHGMAGNASMRAMDS